MKKVLYLLDTIQTGGAEKSLALIASYFEEYEAVFVQIYKGDNTIPPNTTFENFKIVKLNIIGKYNFNEAVKALIPIFKKERPTIIHSALFRADIISRKMKRIFPQIPLINSFVNNSYAKVRYEKLDFEHKVKLKLIEWYDRWTANRVDLFFSNSHTISQSNIKALKINPEKVKVVFRGRIIDDIKLQSGKKKIFLDEINLHNRNILINVSRLLDRKGQLDLINAMPGIIKKFPNSILLIVGEGNYRKRLEKAIRELNLKGYVFLLGYRKDINELLSISNVFVFPSYYEGLPGALIEAMIAGIPIVCSDIPENKECVNEESAVFFKSGNIHDLEKKLKLILDAPEETLVNIAAQRQAREKFDVRKIAAEYENIYKSLYIK
ncbi:glycosyltransferase [Christiangramia sp.]|uniref:glycosyltransferase n=1 Tax=Christiangramia sp. TaxID=1931228 RepID=UPI0026352E24|nr:glycosyltransferase [Christiangramia sp.]